jgi:hypothetical protein
VSRKSEIPEIPKVDGKFQCPWNGCNKKEKQRYKIKSHFENIHMKVTRFACSVCKKEDYCKKNLERHMETHQPLTDRTAYQCGECEKKYLRESDLRDKHHKDSGHTGCREIKGLGVW